MRNWVIGTKQLASVRCSTTRNATTNQSHTISNGRCHRHRHCVKNYWLPSEQKKGAGQHLSGIRRVKLNLQSQTRLSGHFPRASRYCDESTRKLSQGPLHGSECRQQQQNARLVTQ